MRYRIKDKQQVIDWFNNFADFIEESDNDLYNEAQDKEGQIDNT